MADEKDNKTHVLMRSCIISELGRCEAGHMLNKLDLSECTWIWLEQRGFLKSVADIEREADAESEVTEPAETEPEATEPVVTEPQQSNAVKARAARKPVPATE